MGEIFTVERPAAVLEFTGERMTSDAHGQIEYEHLHRYCFARLFCRGKDVVDVAAGEGYGSALLAQVANRVTGVEMAADAVGHAISAYGRDNLSFIRGDARHLPLQSNVADVVVSFETIEHLYEQQLFLTEIRRILRPGGVLVISSPDSEVYSYTGSPVNPFHLRELTRDEFKEALSAVFPNTQFYSQRALIGSALTIDGPSNGVITFERRSDDYVDAGKGLPRAPYLVAVASAHSLDDPFQTLYIDLTRSAYLLTSRFGGTDTTPTPIELEGALAAANSRLQESAARESAALAEIDRQQTLIAELTRQKDAVMLEAADALHDEIAGLHERLTQTERETVELRETLAAVEPKAREFERIAPALNAASAHSNGGAVRRLTTHLKRRVRRRGVGALIRAGDGARDGGSWALAAPYYRRALEKAPELAPIWVQLGHALKEQGDHAAAEAAYRRSLALDGSVWDTLLQLGHVLKLQDRWEEAAEAYARAMRLGPTRKKSGIEVDLLFRGFIEEGDKASGARNWPAAARHYQRALALQPDLLPIWLRFGQVLREKGDYAEAEAAYRHAWALDRSIADTHLQLGHLLRRQERRVQAIDAYATAIRLDPGLVAAREALRALVGSSPSQTELAIMLKLPAATGSGLPNGGLELADRYGPLSADASRKTGTGHDVIWLGVIDWHFRTQRPQHLATNLADAGARIFYISVGFEPADEKGRFRIIGSPHLGVFEIRLRLWDDTSETIYQGLSEAAVGELHVALDEMIGVLGISAPIVLVEHPAWHQVACGVPGATVVYDCLDLASGFNNTANSLAASETAMLASADLVISASRPLAEHVSQQRSSILIRNAAEVEFFARAASNRVAGKRPVIGYFGAIAEWFNVEWIEHCAVARPDWDFRLIGHTDGCDTLRAARLANVRFYGEKPYQELPDLLREFDVAIIPFKIVELTRCTNPVKLYEYMAAGKPVIASAIPEVIEATDLVYIADDARSFADRIDEALAEDSATLRARRQEWAREHNWASRAGQLAEALDASFPLVSVVVLTYNGWEYTKACLFAVRNWSDYPNLEIIVVDNASTDGSRQRLRDLERQDERVRVILNDANLGVAGGYNVGLRAARGDYVILLNNDTFVTRGWVRDLIRPMQLDSKIGLSGPLTNDIGNEQRVKIAYGTMPEMHQAARRFVRDRLRCTLEVPNLAFFCVAIRRSVIEEIGLLDEVYGLGYYEDDDYCRRASQANYKLVIADDVFVHHDHSVSFDKLGGKAAELMARNRVIFEQRWGPWPPHRYRDEAGFGS